LPKPKLVIVIGDGILQRVSSNIAGIEILLIDSGMKGDCSELNGDDRHTSDLIEPELDGHYVDLVFDCHRRKKLNEHEEFDA